MDKAQLKATLSDPEKVKGMIANGFAKGDPDKKGYITWETFIAGVHNQMKAIGMDLALAPVEVIERVKPVADPKNEGKVTQETCLAAVTALVKIAMDTGNL